VEKKGKGRPADSVRIRIGMSELRDAVWPEQPNWLLKWKHKGSPCHTSYRERDVPLPLLQSGMKMGLMRLVVGREGNGGLWID